VWFHTDHIQHEFMQTSASNLISCRIAFGGKQGEQCLKSYIVSFPRVVPHFSVNGTTEFLDKNHHSWECSIAQPVCVGVYVCVCVGVCVCMWVVWWVGVCVFGSVGGFFSVRKVSPKIDHVSANNGAGFVHNRLTFRL